MIKINKTAGLVVLTRIEYDRAGKAAPHISELALRAADVEKVQPLNSVSEPEAKAVVMTNEKAYWVKETVAEVVAKVNARTDAGEDSLRRIAIALEAIQQYGIKADA